MPISERVIRGLSVSLITALAIMTVGWTVAGQGGTRCSLQDHPCAPKAILTCCCHSSPAPLDTARLRDGATPTGPSFHASLMGIELPAICGQGSVSTSRHALQQLNLRILHQTLLI